MGWCLVSTAHELNGVILGKFLHKHPLLKLRVGDHYSPFLRGRGGRRDGQGMRESAQSSGHREILKKYSLVNNNKVVYPVVSQEWKILSFK